MRISPPMSAMCRPSTSPPTTSRSPSMRAVDRRTTSLLIASTRPRTRPLISTGPFKDGHVSVDDRAPPRSRRVPWIATSRSSLNRRAASRATSRGSPARSIRGSRSCAAADDPASVTKSDEGQTTHAFSGRSGPAPPQAVAVPMRRFAELTGFTHTYAILCPEPRSRHVLRRWQRMCLSDFTPRRRVQDGAFDDTGSAGQSSACAPLPPRCLRPSRARAR